MVGIGFGLLWVGYTGGFWAYCLLKGYNVTLGQVVSYSHPYSGPWPPPPVPTDLVFPGTAPPSTSTIAKKGGGTPKKPAPKGKCGGSTVGPPVVAV
jgi:hypothetical protein